MKEEPIKDDFLVIGVELKKFRALKRVCYMCCDPIDCIRSTFNKL
jgi:hypothetical protein